MNIKYIPYKNITFCCRDCGTQISWVSALQGQGRCRSCATKGKNHPLFGKHHSKKSLLKMSRSISGKNHPFFGKRRPNFSGKNHPFFGKQHTKETLLKMSKSKIGKNNPIFGKKLSKEHRLKLSKAHKGENHPFFGKRLSKKHCLNISKGRKGIKFSKEHRLKMSKSKIGKNNHCWRGGVSFLPYSCEFTKELKLKIRERDNFKCQCCQITEKEHVKKFGNPLPIHHIDYDKQNCKEDNLISLCYSCNSIANGNKDLDRNYWFAYYTYIIKHFKEHVATF